MKAFILYPKEQAQLYQLLLKLQPYGQVNCSFEQFSDIYSQWHNQTFPNQPVSPSTATFREDWFISFLQFLGNYEI